MASKYVITAVDLKGIIEKIDAKGTLDYTDLKGLIEVDPYPINQYLTETLNFSDIAALATERGLTDSATIQEVASILFGLSATDAVTVSESAVIESGPGVVDSLAVTENQLFTVGKALSDTLGITESLQLLVFVERFPTDTITISDTPAILFSFPATESLSVTESSFLGIGKVFNDAFTVEDDVVSDTFELSKNKQNVFSMLESHAIDFSTTLADAPVLSESAALAFSTVESDSISMGDDSVELRLNGFLVGAESSVFNAQSLNEFTLNS